MWTSAAVSPGRTRSAGLSAEVRGRGLLTHEAGGFRERGFSGRLAWEPTPETGRGLKLSLSQTVGAQASGGMDGLLERNTLVGLAANDNGSGSGAGDPAQHRFEMKLGYGLSAFGDRFTWTPEAGLGLSNAGRDYSLGWRLPYGRRGRTARRRDPARRGPQPAPTPAGPARETAALRHNHRISSERMPTTIRFCPMPILPHLISIWIFVASVSLQPGRYNRSALQDGEQLHRSSKAFEPDGKSCLWALNRFT